jgi:FkbM family methyltransferase
VLRTLVEKTTKSLVFRRRLPARLGGGSLLVSPSAGLKFLFRPLDNIDPTLFRLADEYVHTGDTVWDIGANVGLFAFAAAHLAGAEGRVFAIEPDAWLVQLLRRSALIQPKSSAPVQVIPTAAARSCDLREFDVAVRSRSASSLAGYGSTQTGGIAERQTVLSVTLDWLAQRLPLPACIKIDVEGAELEVLAGSLALLKKAQPIIICEVCSEQSVDVTALLREHGYLVYDGEASAGERNALDTATWTTVAIPAR